MLNVAKLSELLTKNVDSQLYPRMFVMSPNGTLMAYSTPVDIKELRDQAALISMAWKEHKAKHEASRQPDSEADNSTLETLSIETQNCNIIVRSLQSSLLLVLVGAVPPARKTNFKITPESASDARYPKPELPEVQSHQQPIESDSSVEASAPTANEEEIAKKKASSTLSTMSSGNKDVMIGVLHIQRKKLDAMTNYLRADFNANGFVMPDDSSLP